jgi:hypothetical protein
MAKTPTRPIPSTLPPAEDAWREAEAIYSSNSVPAVAQDPTGRNLPANTSGSSTPVDRVTPDGRPPLLGDPAERHKRAMASHCALIERYTTLLVDAGLEAQQHRNGRELTVFESEPQKISDLVAALVNGNYLDASCALADLSYSGVRAWLKAYDEGDPRYHHVGRLIRAAEAIAESEAVGLVRAAGTDPRFWAAPATWLERKFPQKYGRRQDENDSPKVIVQIGVKDSDVKVNVLTAASLPPRIPDSAP